MHFKIEKSGCVEHKGLCQVRADFYYDESDKDYALTDVKIFPPEGYQGKVEGAMNTPVDMEDYNKWYDSLPTTQINLPVNSHFIYFDPEHLNDLENILFCAEIAKDWKKNDKPMLNKYENGKKDPVWKPEKASLSAEKMAIVLKTDFTKLPNSKLYSVK